MTRDDPGTRAPSSPMCCQIIELQKTEQSSFSRMLPFREGAAQTPEQPAGAASQLWLQHGSVAGSRRGSVLGGRRGSVLDRTPPTRAQTQEPSG